MQPTRLSSSRSLIAKMARERWSITRPEFVIDVDGKGTARYHIVVDDDWSFEFIVFSAAADRTVERTDRIIGRHWDMMGALVEGAADNERIEMTKRELPKLYGGRASEGTLVWARANRSMRAFDYTVERLARGQQPEVDVLGAVCYLMRNTGLDGNGTFGTRTFAAYESDHPLRAPYHAQMLSAYLMREFSMDLAEHIAGLSSTDAVALSEEYRRFLGLGNASGLGLLLFAKHHPDWMDHWITLREQELAGARSLPLARRSVEIEDALRRAAAYRRRDRMRYSYQSSGPVVARDLDTIIDRLALLLSVDGTVDDLVVFAESEVGIEAQEVLNGILIDLVADEIDPSSLAVARTPEFAPALTVRDLTAILDRDYDWARTPRMAQPSAQEMAWYKSANAEEPRRGPIGELPERFEDMTLDIPRDVQNLRDAVRSFDDSLSIGAVLRALPEQRGFVERVVALRNRVFHTIHADLRDPDFNPSQGIRFFNSAVYGLDKTKEDGPTGVVGVMFHGAPTPADLADGRGADFSFPTDPEVIR
jgi:hypothetical protein